MKAKMSSNSNRAMEKATKSAAPRSKTALCAQCAKKKTCWQDTDEKLYCRKCWTQFHQSAPDAAAVAPRVGAGKGGRSQGVCL